MKVKFHKKFTKSFRKLKPVLQLKAKDAIFKFMKNPNDSSLRNHNLNGKLKELKAFWVTGDIRIIYQEFDDYTLVIMINIGSHNQVY